MTYYVRYALVDPNPIRLSEIKKGLCLVNPSYTIDADLLVFEDEEYGQIRISKQGDILFTSDLELMKRFAERKENSAFLLAALQKVRSVVVVQVIWSRGQSETWQVIEGMFNWLMENRAGLLMDEDGSFYYDLAEPVTCIM